MYGDDLGDLELLRRFERGDARLYDELARRVRRDRGWLSAGFAMYLPREGGGIERIGLPTGRPRR